MKRKQQRALALAGVLCLLSTAGPSPNPAALANSGPQATDAETQRKIREVEKKREEMRARLDQARKKEQLALLQLHKVQRQLNVTTGALIDSKHKLKKTETRINETERGLQETRLVETRLSEQAMRRLREIYEGQRLSLLEMFFQVQSLQALLDLFYYQQRVAEMDRKLLSELRARAQALEARKQSLGQQKNKLGDLVSEFAQKALMINKEKLNQEQIANRLKTQREFYERAERQLALESQQLERQIVDLESSNKRNNKEVTQGSGSLSMPLHAQVTSPFGWRRHPIFRVKKFHTGIDLAGPNRSPIRAADSGTVLSAGWYGGYGKVVIISHGNGMATLYAHLSKIAVTTGQSVDKGDVIAYEGTTGFSTGPHLHFEVRVNGKPNNPMEFLK